MDLASGESTTSSVSAEWSDPGGVLEYFEIECSNGTLGREGGYILLNDSYMADDLYTASCENLTTPGDNYTLRVTSFSYGKGNAAEIVLTACKHNSYFYNLPVICILFLHKS